MQYQFFKLDNGLEVYVVEEFSAPKVIVNICYKVGSRYERPEKTGFAHLFEHLMFAGSANIPDIDKQLSSAGASLNAFTSFDITNYYEAIPAENVETALWVESDRMLSLNFKPEILERERKVVIEEFKQRYLNQPYGDKLSEILSLAYKVHPYRWQVIGLEIPHIEQATLEEVKAFFNDYYAPNNAVMVIGGAITFDAAKTLVTKWFDSIPAKEIRKPIYDQEPPQNEYRLAYVDSKVPVKSILKAYHIPSEFDLKYAAIIALNFLIGRNDSSYLYQKLVIEEKIFSEIGSFTFGLHDPGLLLIDGLIADGVSIEDANSKLDTAVASFLKTEILTHQLQQVINAVEAQDVFGNMNLGGTLTRLAMHAAAGRPNYKDQLDQQLRGITPNLVMSMATQTLRLDNCSTILYNNLTSEAASE